LENKETELQAVEKRIKQTKDRRMFERNQTIRLYLIGQSAKGRDVGSGRFASRFFDWIEAPEISADMSYILRPGNKKIRIF
jgi:hypothetical protein